jgi:hypothetical protein
MNEKNENCRCENAVCGCAKQVATRCSCGETCNCKRECRCGGGCDCAEKK